MELKVKIGLIIALLGIFLFILYIVFYLTFYPYIGIFFLPFAIILTGGLIIYFGLSQKGRGYILNGLGIYISVYFAIVLCLIVIWIDTLITLIIVVTLFWIIVLNIPGILKIIMEEDINRYFFILIYWAGCVMFCVMVYTMIIAATAPANFSEKYFPTLLHDLLILFAIGTVIAIVIGILSLMYR